MYPFGHVPPKPAMAPKGVDWLSRSGLRDRLDEEVNPRVFHDVWDRLVGEAWLGQGTVLAGRRVGMMLCHEGFADEWCLAVDDVGVVSREVSRIEAEVEATRRTPEPMPAPPKTAEWLTQGEVASALVLRRSDRNLHDFLFDLGMAVWNGTKPKLTDAKLRVGLRTLRGKQQWCVHRDDIKAFGKALDAAIVDFNTPKPAPDGWLTISRLAIMSGYSVGALSEEWGRQAAGRFVLNGREEEMLPPDKAYRAALATSTRMSVERRYIPIGYLKEDFEEGERAQAREYLTQLADEGTKARLGPMSVCYPIAKIEDRDGRRIPYVHPECVERFKDQVKVRMAEVAEVDVEACPGIDGP